MKIKINFAIVAVGLLAIVSLLMRLVPHPANFVPIAALALLAGTYLRRRWAVLLPVAVMAISDLFIGLHSVILFTWGSFLLVGMLGWWIRREKNIWRVTGGTLAGSVIFYLVTNFAVWAFTPLYAKTFAGLVQSYYMAIPFFRNTVLGDVFYAAVFFGTYEIAAYLVRQRQTKATLATEKK